MFPPVVAERIRAHGRDAVCVAERSDLVGRADEEVFVRAEAEGRVVVPENVGDFLPTAGSGCVQVMLTTVSSSRRTAAFRAGKSARSDGSSQLSSAARA